MTENCGAFFPSATWSSTSSQPKARRSSISKATFTAAIDRVAVLRGERLIYRIRRLTRTPLQLPDRLAVDDRANGTPFQFPAIKWRIARERFARFSRPFHIWIDQRDVGLRANRQRAGIDFQQLRRLQREHLDQPVDRNRFPFVHQNIDEQSELGFEPDNSERRLIEFNFLFKGSVRRMIAAKNR